MESQKEKAPQIETLKGGVAGSIFIIDLISELASSVFNFHIFAVSFHIANI